MEGETPADMTPFEDEEERYTKTKTFNLVDDEELIRNI